VTSSDYMRSKALKTVRAGHVVWLPADDRRPARFGVGTTTESSEITSVLLRVALCELRQEQEITVDETTGAVQVVQP
jgi:hypothetical protein